MARERNAGREIAVSLLAAVLFGTGFAAYLLHTMPSKQAPLLAPAADGLTALAPELVAATLVVESFGRALAQKDYRAAYGLMAKQYRGAVTLEAFTEACQTSLVLSNVQRAVLRSTRHMVVSEGPYTEQGTGVLVTSAGSMDATFTLLVNGSDRRLLVVSLAGVPVLDGISVAVDAPPRSAGAVPLDAHEHKQRR